MANEIAGALQGLSDVLESTGVKVYPYEIDFPQHYPALVYLNLTRENMALGGSSFRAVLSMRLYVNKAITEQATAEAWALVEPTGLTSIEAAIDADHSWNNTVDTGRLVLVENVGRQVLENGAEVMAADLTITFIKQVLT